MDGNCHLLKGRLYKAWAQTTIDLCKFTLHVPCPCSIIYTLYLHDTTCNYG